MSAFRPFRSIAAKNRATWSPSAKDLANRLSAHLETEIAAQEALDQRAKEDSNEQH